MNTLPRWTRTVSVIVAVLSLFAVAAGAAGAQRGGQQAGGGDGQGTGPQVGPRDIADAHMERLAANLGVSVETLRAAMAQTHEEMRPMMQERMDQMRDRMRAHLGEMHEGMQGPMGEMGRAAPPHLGPGAERGPHDRPMGPLGTPLFGLRPLDRAGAASGPGQMMSTVAGMLSLQPEELRDLLASGQPLAEIARAQGVDPDALADQITATFIRQHESQMRALIRESMEHSFRGPRSE